MTSSFVIRPDVINVLCGDPLPIRRVSAEDQVQPESQKQTLWGKVGGFFKKSWAYLLALLGVLPPTINALARLKGACNRSQSEKNKKKGGKKGEGD